MVSRDRLAAIISSVLTACIFVVFSASTVLAAPDVRVGFVDTRKALENTRAGKQAQKAFESRIEGAKKVLDKQRTEFERKRDSFLKKKDSLSDEARVKQEQELLALEKELKRTIEDSREELGRANDVASRDLIVKLKETVDAVGKEEGFTLIIERNAKGVLYTDSSIDITDKVIERFNETN